MPRFLFTLIFAFMLCLPAFAAEKTFTSLTMDVPEDWQVALEDPVTLINTKTGSTLSAGVTPANGQSAEALAKVMSEGFKGQTPIAEGDGYLFTANVMEQESRMFVRVVNDTGIFITMIGKDEALLPMAKSAKPK